MKTKNRKPRAASSRPRRRRREEQLEFDLAPRDDRIAPLTPDLRGTNRIPPASETQAKRLRAGVLVQQMLK